MLLHEKLKLLKSPDLERMRMTLSLRYSDERMTLGPNAKYQSQATNSVDMGCAL